jgi:hypothetical protein
MLLRDSEIFLGGDNLFHFSRANKMLNQDVKLYQNYIFEDVPEIYPPGYPMIISYLSLLGLNYFIIELFMTIFVSIIYLLLVFIISSRVNFSFAIISVLFALSRFNIITIIRSKELGYVAGLWSIHPAMFSYIISLTLFITIYSIITEKNIKNVINRYILLVLLLTTQGLLHLDSFMWNLIMTTIIFTGITFINADKDNIIKSLAGYGSILIALIFQFILYWRVVIDYIIVSDNSQNIKHKLVSILLNLKIEHLFLLIILVVFTISLIILFNRFKLLVKVKDTAIEFTKTKMVFLFGFLYFTTIIILLINLNIVLNDFYKIHSPFVVFFGGSLDFVSITLRIMAIVNLILIIFALIRLKKFDNQYYYYMLTWFIITFIFSISYISPIPFQSFDFSVNLGSILPFIFAFGITKLITVLKKFKLNTKLLYFSIFILIIIITVIPVISSSLFKEPVVGNSLISNPLINEKTIQKVPLSLHLLDKIEIYGNSLPLLTTHYTSDIITSITNHTTFTSSRSMIVPFYIDYNQVREISNSLNLIDINYNVKKYGFEYIILTNYDLRYGDQIALGYAKRNDISLNDYSKAYIDKTYTNSLNEHIYYPKFFKDE